MERNPLGSFWEGLAFSTSSRACSSSPVDRWAACSWPLVPGAELGTKTHSPGHTEGLPEELGMGTFRA